MVSPPIGYLSYLSTCRCFNVEQWNPLYGFSYICLSLILIRISLSTFFKKGRSPLSPRCYNLKIYDIGGEYIRFQKHSYLMKSPKLTNTLIATSRVNENSIH